jgi:RNA polymerase sigma factor (sigma-70 family)
MRDQPSLATQAATLERVPWPGGGDAQRNEIVSSIYEPLRQFARQLLNEFRCVRKWEQADDVAQETALRLLSGLPNQPAALSQDLSNLARRAVREVLVDLARRYSGPKWRCTHASAPAPGSNGARTELEIQGNAEEHDLEAWTTLQQAIWELPAEEREVVHLSLHHHWKQQRIARLFHVTVRTIRTRLQSAVVKLRHCASKC